MTTATCRYILVSPGGDGDEVGTRDYRYAEVFYIRVFGYKRSQRVLRVHQLRGSTALKRWSYGDSYQRYRTGLENLINDNNIDLLVLCGQAAEHCVVFTYRGAQERGYKTAILQNGVISQKPGRVTTLMEDRNTISYPVIEELVGEG